MNIAKNNYEAYFLDYYEGNLSTQGVADLFLFLSLHPELKAEFEEFENIKLDDTELPVFENKIQLKKSSVLDNTDYYFISAVEGTLTPSEQLLFTAFLKQQPAFLTTVNAYKKTKLTANTTLIFKDKERLKKTILSDASLDALVGKLRADTEIVYPYKQLLKKEKKKIIPLFYYVATAASVALLIGLAFIFKTGYVKEQSVIAEKQLLLPNKQKNVDSSAPLLGTSSEQTALKDTNSSVALSDKRPLKMRAEITQSNVVKDLAAKVNDTAAASSVNLIADNSVELKNNALPADSTRSVDNYRLAAAIAKMEMATTIPPTESKFSTVGDLLKIRIKEKLVDKEIVDADERNKHSAKMSGWDIVTSVAKGINKATGAKIAVQPKFNEQGDLTAYAFSAGKLGFSRGK